MALNRIPDSSVCLTTSLISYSLIFKLYVFCKNWESRAGLMVWLTGGSWAVSPIKINFELVLKSAKSIISFNIDFFLNRSLEFEKSDL